MELPFEQIREQQRVSWNRFSPGWKKWDELLMDFLKPMGDEMMQQLNLRDGAVVLDVAAGTGEPGLTIASKLKGGKVVITDLAEDMLDIAEENAIRREISNIETIACDVCELPFADNSFDAISCRFGFMFFPDMLLAAKEMVRVLKPGGQIAAAVWDTPEKNFWIMATMEAINRNMNLPPGAPGMFRCAQDGLVTGLFQQACLKNIYIKEVEGQLKAKTVDVYWKAMNEIVAPVIAALSNTDDAMREKIKTEVYQAISIKYPGNNLQIDGSALVISGEK